MSRFADHVPRELRRAWASAGHCPDRDLFALFTEHRREHPDKPAVLDERGAVSYAELDDLARRTAAGLADLGVGEGDVVGVQLDNDRWACGTELAVAALGAVALPYPPGRGDMEAASLLGRAGARAAVVLAEHRGFPCAARTRALGDQLPDLEVVVAHGDVAGCPSLEELAATGRSFQPAAPDPDGPARILISSGSEAEPKMVLYSHNALAGGRGRFMGELRRRSPQLRNLFLLPLGSAFGAHAVPSALAAHGGTLVLQERFAPGSAAAAIDEHRPDHVFAVPTMLRRLLDHAPEFSPRAFVLGGGALDAGTARRAGEVLGSAVINLYGSADGVTCHSDVDGRSDVDGLPDGSVGRPDPAAAEIRVVDEQLQDVPTGEIGEILARGPMTPMRYVGAPELDERKRTRGGWVRTGDAGFLGANGTLTVVGRREDVINRGGLNISPAQVEGVLTTHPQVADAACVPVADPVLGERMCACVASGAQLTLDQITAHLGERGLDPRRFPELLLVLPRLPLGPAGKVDRRQLRERAEQRAVAA